MSLLTSLINFVIHALASNQILHTDTSAVFTDCRNHRMGKSSPQCPSSMADENILPLSTHILNITFGTQQNATLIMNFGLSCFSLCMNIFFKFITFDHQHCKQTLPRSQGYIWPIVECRKPPVNKENHIQLFIPIF